MIGQTTIVGQYSHQKAVDRAVMEFLTKVGFVAYKTHGAIISQGKEGQKNHIENAPRLHFCDADHEPKICKRELTELA